MTEQEKIDKLMTDVSSILTIIKPLEGIRTNVAILEADNSRRNKKEFAIWSAIIACFISALFALI